MGIRDVFGLEMRFFEKTVGFDCGSFIDYIYCNWLWGKGLCFSDKIFWVKRVLKLLRKIEKSL